MSKRVPARELTHDEIENILKLTRKDITATKLKDLFAIDQGKSRAKFQPNDTFTLSPNKFFNKTQIKTTIGRYIYNMFCIPEPYLKKFGYMNDELVEDMIGDLEKRMGSMILNDELSTKEYAEFMDNSEWIGMNMCYYIAPSLDNEVVIPIPEVIKRKEELFDQYKTEINKGDINAVNTIEGELLKMAKNKIESLDDPAYDNYKCGIFKFPVAYKKSSIMVGAISDPKDGHLHILKSDYVDGISKDEYDKTAQLTVIGGYSRGVSTQKYGYETKKYNASLQNVSINTEEEQIDCGTKHYLTITIPKNLKSMFLYRYVIDGSKLVELLPENIDNYVDKEVKLRSPMFCKGDTICQHCAGTLFKRMDLKDCGLIVSNMTGNLLNLSMKKMHDSTVKINKINIENFITER